MTRTGHAIERAISTNASRPAVKTSDMDRAPASSTGPRVWARVAPSVSNAQSTRYSTAIVECGSLAHRPAHHSANPRRFSLM
jgi:hypothetical protein